ncbi:hydroxysteroid dehydrogenase-like protein [Euroglyphus maynei]|uniref:Hydroxysteroid dehydrogenase-like protein 2 n=1 Tax=Euroglyphus maynei TaxID=6958 RepID=A0A1Y3BNS6_EURMA|nr:hydroxysteroid dehydrogenase-like protein [Euroglyphus maynei]
MTRLFHKVVIKNHSASILAVRSHNALFIGQQYRLFADATPSETEKLFEKAKTLVDDKLKSEINATMVFCISGKNILFDANKDRPLKIEVCAGDPPKADVTFIAEDNVFMKLAKGEMKSTMAFMTGKLKIKGDIKLAQRAEKMFKVMQKEVAFAGKTVFVTGGSRGIGKAIALKMAKDGCNVVIAAKTTDPHPKLEGTIFTAAKEIENNGGKCLPVQCDLRDEEAVIRAVNQAIDKFGKIDVLVNNASAISLTGTEETTMKKYDLMNQINARGTFMTSKYCIPHLKQSSNPHILNLSPPLEMKPRWFAPHVAYSMAKFGMSLCVLGMAEEFKEQGIAVNALWPRTAIWTAAMGMLSGGQQEMAKMCRKIDIMADAAYAITSKDSKSCTGNFFIDEEVLRNEGITDFDPYAIEPGTQLMGDFFIPERLMEGLAGMAGTSEEGKSSMTDDSSSSSSDRIMAVLNQAKLKMTDKIKDEINAVLVFVVSGRTYLFDSHSTRPLKIEVLEQAPNTCDVQMITDEETFIQMATGKIKPTNAFMSGKLKIKGNLQLAIKAEKIFKTVNNS